MTVHLDHGALARIANSADAQAAAERTAQQIAQHARAQGITVGDLTHDGVGVEIALPVEVDGATVALAHPAGIAVQAKHGTLTRAAAAAGLSVKG